jgi:putative heme-binding domain-containing protein
MRNTDQRLNQVNVPAERAADVSPPLAGGDRGRGRQSLRVLFAIIIAASTAFSAEKKPEERRKEFLDQAANEDLSDAQRIVALRQAIPLGVDAELVSELLRLATPKANDSFNAGLVEELALSDSPAVATELLKRWRRLPPATQRAGINVLLTRPKWATALLDAMATTHKYIALKPDQIQHLLRYPDPTIVAKAKVFLDTKDRVPDADRAGIIHTMSPLIHRKGDFANGKAVFQQRCAQCHRHGDSGGSGGPDLTAISLQDRAAIAISLLDPNRDSDPRYREHILQTSDGRVLFGTVKNETPVSFEFTDSESRTRVFARKDIAKLIPTKLSPMPEGFERLGGNDLRNLLEFLTTRPRFIPLPLQNVATIASNQSMFSGEGVSEKISMQRWGPQLVNDIPFFVPEPEAGAKNVLLLYGPKGAVSSTMPKSISVPLNAPANALHLLSGVSGNGFPLTPKDTVSLIVRLHYEDGADEDRELRNGVHFADFNGDTDVPESKLALKLRNQQLRFLTISPKRPGAVIKSIEFIKGPDDTAPLILAITLEGIVTRAE